MKPTTAVPKNKPDLGSNNLKKVSMEWWSKKSGF